MKLKKLKEYPVRCSFCKEKKALHKIVGYPYGGRTACQECFNKLDNSDNTLHEDSEGERQVYSMYRI